MREILAETRRSGVYKRRPIRSGFHRINPDPVPIGFGYFLVVCHRNFVYPPGVQATGRGATSRASRRVLRNVRRPASRSVHLQARNREERTFLDIATQMRSISFARASLSVGPPGVGKGCRRVEEGVRSGKNRKTGWRARTGVLNKEETGKRTHGCGCTRSLSRYYYPRETIADTHRSDNVGR